MSIPDVDEVPVNDDSLNYIKIAIRGMFPINQLAIDTKFVSLDEKRENEKHCDDKLDSLDSEGDLKPASTNEQEMDNESKHITTNIFNHSLDENPEKYQDSEDESDTESTSSETDDEDDSYIESSEKISAMNFLLDSSQDYLDSEEFFPKEFYAHEPLREISEQPIFPRPNNFYTPHKLDLFSNNLVETSESADEDSYSDTSSEAESIDSIRYIEDTEDDLEREATNQHIFISEILNSLLTKSMSEPNNGNEVNNNEQDLDWSSILPLENSIETVVEDTDIFCESPLDDFHSDTGSEKGISTDEGIIDTSDEEKEIEKDYKKGKKVADFIKEPKAEPFYHSFDTLF